MDLSTKSTDNALIVSKNAESILRNELKKCFELKEELIRLLITHLGGSIWNVVLKNLVESSAFSSSQHAKASVNNVESYLKK